MTSTKHILIYNDKGVAASELKTALQGRFIGARTKDINRLQIKRDNALSEDTLALFLPGIIGDDSPYSDQLGLLGNIAIRDYIKQGGVFIGICAGAYYATERITYHPPWRDTPKTKQPKLDLFNGAAKGPIPTLAKQGIEEGRSDCTLTTISFNTASGIRKTTSIAYGNGPMYFPDNTDGLEVIARYEDVAGHPIAIAARKIGNGLAIFVGVLPYMQPLMEVNMEAAHRNAAFYHLNEGLKKDAQPIEEIWNLIINRIKKHNIDIGRVQPLPAPRP